MQAIPPLPFVEGKHNSQFQMKPLTQDDQVEGTFRGIWGDDFADTLVGFALGSHTLLTHVSYV